MNPEPELNLTVKINLVPTRDMEENARLRVERAIEETIKNKKSSDPQRHKIKKYVRNIHKPTQA